MTRPLLTAGDGCPLPGNSVFHFTFSVALQFRGNPLSVTVPSARRPRHIGQSSALASGGCEPPVTATTRPRAAKNARACIGVFSGGVGGPGWGESRGETRIEQHTAG